MVEKIHEHDDGDRLPHWKKVLNRFGPLATALAMGSYFLYFGFRIYYTLAAQREYHKVYVMAWLFIAAEAALAGKGSAQSRAFGKSRLRSRTWSMELTSHPYQCLRLSITLMRYSL